ncbi:MAG: hypothetical protein AAF471_09440 [Myxococcota bacterium]
MADPSSNNGLSSGLKKLSLTGVQEFVPSGNFHPGGGSQQQHAHKLSSSPSAGGLNPASSSFTSSAGQRYNASRALGLPGPGPGGGSGGGGNNGAAGLSPRNSPTPSVDLNNGSDPITTFSDGGTTYFYNPPGGGSDDMVRRPPPPPPSSSGRTGMLPPRLLQQQQQRKGTVGVMQQQQQQRHNAMQHQPRPRWEVRRTFSVCERGCFCRHLTANAHHRFGRFVRQREG